MTLKLVAIDLDETLLKNDKTFETERFDTMIEALVNQGVTILIASGNDVNKIKSYLSDETIEKVYLAGDNGNDVEQAGEHIHTNYFDYEALDQVADLVDADDDLQMVVNTQEKTYSKYIYEKDKDFIDLYYDTVHIVDSYEDLPEDEYPIKGAMLSSKSLDETKEIVEKINKEIEGITSVTSGQGWFDIYDENGGKGSAIQWVQSEKEISMDETMAFGDSLNDKSMMEYAKFSVAMENADEELKEICNYEIGTNEDQAVLDILEKRIETGNMDFMKEYKR